MPSIVSITHSQTFTQKPPFNIKLQAKFSFSSKTFPNLKPLKANQNQI